MDTKAIDGYTRQYLWDRLEQADYFDWCRKEEYRQSRALYFDGVVEEFPKTFVTCRELVWIPLRGEAHWRSVLEARSRYQHIDTGETCMSEIFGEEYAVKQLEDLLLNHDQQHYGMAIDDQIALIDFLGIERLHPRLARDFLEAWSAEMWLWLAGEARGEYGIAGLADTRATRQRELFYRLLSEAPVAVKGVRLLPTEERIGWSDFHVRSLHESFKLLFSQLDNYRMPKKLACDPARRLQFVEAMRNDLESDRAPPILREVWQLWKTGKANARAKAQARAAAKLQSKGN